MVSGALGESTKLVIFSRRDVTEGDYLVRAIGI